MIDLRRSIEKIYLYQGAPLSGASFKPVITEQSPPKISKSLTKRKSITSAYGNRRKEKYESAYPLNINISD
jgi:hypothetical protein